MGGERDIGTDLGQPTSYHDSWPVVGDAEPPPAPQYPPPPAPPAGTGQPEPANGYRPHQHAQTRPGPVRLGNPGPPPGYGAPRGGPGTAPVTGSDPHPPLVPPSAREHPRVSAGPAWPAGYDAAP